MNINSPSPSPNAPWRLPNRTSSPPLSPTGSGNWAAAIRKSEPAEAEALYREAAALWESKGQLQSATPAWSNLGILCSDQARFEEALDYYDRVRRLRESMPGTPLAALG